MSGDEALAEARERMDRAARELRRQAAGYGPAHREYGEYLRLLAKADGVELACSYVDDALALIRPLSSLGDGKEGQQ